MGVVLILLFLQMQWPVYSLAEHASELIRAFHNGVPDPDDPNTSTGGNNDADGNNNDDSTGDSGGTLSLSIPSVLTSLVVLFFAGLAVVL